MKPRMKYGDAFAALRLSRILRHNGIQVTLLTQSRDLHLAAIASKLLPGLKVVFYQQMDSGYNKRDVLHSLVFSRIARWYTLTEEMRKKVLTCTRVPAHTVEVVPLGIDVKHFDATRYKKSAARKAFGLPTRGKLIGVLGRLDSQKGQEVVLRALPALLKKHAGLHCVIAGEETAGEPGYKAQLEDLCASLSIRPNVTFLPFTGEVPQFMSALDTFILPSYAETYGLVVIEAMAMGCPVIATNAGGVPEIVQDGKTGLLVTPRDHRELADAIHRLLTSPSLRATMIRSAKTRAAQHFDFNRTVDRLLRSICSL